MIHPDKRQFLRSLLLTARNPRCKMFPLGFEHAQAPCKSYKSTGYLWQIWDSRQPISQIFEYRGWPWPWAIVTLGFNYNHLALVELRFLDFVVWLAQLLTAAAHILISEPNLALSRNAKQSPHLHVKWCLLCWIQQLSIMGESLFSQNFFS